MDPVACTVLVVPPVTPRRDGTVVEGGLGYHGFSMLMSVRPTVIELAMTTPLASAPETAAWRAAVS